MNCDRRQAFFAGMRAALAQRLDGAKPARNPHGHFSGKGLYWRRGRDRTKVMLDQLLEHAP